MMTKRSKYGENWSREETILAFELYCRIPFRLTKRTTPQVVELAELLGRTPSSVARKLGNFGSFDPRLSSRGVVGLTHASRQDRETWEAFQDDWDSLVVEAYEIRKAIGGDGSEIFDEQEADLPLNKPLATEKQQIQRVRIGQQFFRDAVLGSYDSQCCITGLSIRECLVASHIVPWSIRDETRLEPSNGICLSATFDRLFDRFLLTVLPDFSIRLSESMLASDNQYVVESIQPFHECSIRLPERFMPKDEYLLYHNDVFAKSEFRNPQ